jgi:tripartite-type tricarboxylate transporter receptor subunit TctC
MFRPGGALRLGKLRPGMLHAIMASALCLAVSPHAQPGWAEEAYPSKPIHFVVTTAAGGAGDLVARALADRLSQSMGQAVIIENQPAGNGAIAAGQVARATPDGYTLMTVVDSTLTINPHLYRNLPYDPFRDFTPVSIVSTLPLVLVTGSAVKANDVAELVALAKANPGKLNYASTGIGTVLHVGMELFKLMTKTDIVHVPYRATTTAMADVMGGRIDMILIGQSSVKPLMEAGKLRILAIASPRRSALMPEIPTLEEAGVPGYEVRSWFGMLAPARTPQSVIDRLSLEVQRAAADPRFVAALAPQGMQIIASSPGDMRTTLQADSKKWAQVIAATGITINQ